MNVLFTGGGTGGHIYPALAVLEPIRRRGHRVGFVGRGRSREREIVDRHNETHGCTIPYYRVVAVPFPRGRNPLALLRFLLILTTGVLQGTWAILRFHPQAILGTGGYAAAPLMLAAIGLRFLFLYHGRIIVHEQNVQPGLLNRIIARYSTVAAITYPESAAALPGADCVHTGYPVRDEFFVQSDRVELRRQLELDPESFVLLVFGGSQGARNINAALADILPRLLAADIVVIHVTGTHRSEEYDAVAEAERRYEQMRGEHPQLPWDSHYRRHPYLFNIADYFQAVDLLACRAGAGAVFEVAATRSPAILLPKAGLPGDHQTLNALSLQERSACAVLLEEPQLEEDDTVATSDRETRQLECRLSGDRLLELILTLKADPERQATMRRQLEQLVPTSPLETLVDLVLEDKRPAAPPALPSSQLLRLAGLSAADLYYDLENRFRDLKFNPDPGQREYLAYRAGVLLASENWWSRNFGVKLTGLLSAEHHLPLLAAIFRDRQPVSHLQQLCGGDYRQRGFIRRNVIQTLVQFNRYQSEMDELIFEGLFDPYWEVVSQSLNACACYAKSIAPERFFPRVVELLEHRNFEIVQQAVRSFGEWARSDQDLWLLEKLYLHPNPKVREELVRTLLVLRRRGLITDQTRVLDQLRFLLSTSTHFFPIFPLKRELKELLNELNAAVPPDNTPNEQEQR